MNLNVVVCVVCHRSFFFHLRVSLQMSTSASKNITADVDIRFIKKFAFVDGLRMLTSASYFSEMDVDVRFYFFFNFGCIVDVDIRFIFFRNECRNLFQFFFNVSTLRMSTSASVFSETDVNTFGSTQVKFPFDTGPGATPLFSALT